MRKERDLRQRGTKKDFLEEVAFELSLTARRGSGDSEKGKGLPGVGNSMDNGLKDGCECGHIWGGTRKGMKRPVVLFSRGRKKGAWLA